MAIKFIIISTIFVCCCKLTYSEVTVIDDFKNPPQGISINHNREIVGSFINAQGRKVSIARGFRDKKYIVKNLMLDYDSLRPGNAITGFQYLIDPDGSEVWNMEEKAPLIRLNFAHISKTFEGEINITSDNGFLPRKSIKHIFTPNNLHPTINILGKGTYNPQNGIPDLKQVKFISFDLNPSGMERNLTFSLKSIEALSSGALSNIPSGTSSGNLRGVSTAISSRISNDLNSSDALPLVGHTEEVEAVPEPLSALALGSGLVGFMRKKRFKKSTGLPSRWLQS